MKKVKFNHDAENAQEAFGTTHDEFATEVATCVGTFLDDETEGTSSLSHLGEIMQEMLSPKTILLLAAKEVQGTIEKWHDSMMEQLIEKLKSKSKSK
jgi:type II secretory pathway component PulF